MNEMKNLNEHLMTCKYCDVKVGDLCNEGQKLKILARMGARNILFCYDRNTIMKHTEHGGEISMTVMHLIANNMAGRDHRWMMANLLEMLIDKQIITLKEVLQKFCLADETIKINGMTMKEYMK